MSHALSNPYEFTVGGVMVKCSPFSGGLFITNRDLPKSEADLKRFKDVLVEEYNIEEEPGLDGIKVFDKKEKHGGEKIGDTHKSKEQGIADKGSREKRADGKQSA